MPVSRLREQVSDWRQLAEFDQPARILRNIALSGCESKNGYRYSETALKQASRLYDQKSVFLDHAEKRTEPAARSTRDLVGSIVNPRFEEGRLRGDVRVLDTESGRTFLALVEGNSPGVGMSHVVLAQRSVDGTVVERIEDVLSVDVVVRPATTSTFRESEEVGGKPAPTEIDACERTAETLQEVEPEEAASDSDRDRDLLTMLTRVEGLLERLLAAIETGGLAGGTGVQEGARISREAAVPAGVLAVEG
ncbi:MAG TPA: hypothetical protein VM452_20475, partial [Caulifigura sp.]|nr:hypothetical protein [Caulifigura sp.]